MYLTALLKPKLHWLGFSAQKIKLMKLTTAILIITGLQVSANGLSQKVTIRENNISLQKVFLEIRKQTGVQFFYADEALRNAKPVSLSVRNEPLEKVLDLCFRDQPLAYTLTDNTIIVRKKTEAPPVVAALEPEPPVFRDVTGRVTDAQGIPLAGVSVSVKGSTTGTTTNSEGYYNISAPDGATLVFSYVGFIAIEERVDARSVINITLRPSEQPMEQVIVIGYGTQKKRDLTGSVTSVKGEEVARMPALNPVSSLQGKVAGLTIVNSGRAGAAPTVRIRGVNSTGNTDPLYVVDGVFQTNIDYLNPADIESIEVLRDPSSIAIFGLQGGNGVIIVTTKRAGRGQTRVTFQSLVGVQKVVNKIKVTDAAGFKTLYSAQLANLNAAPFDYSNYTADTDWQDLIFQNAVMNNNTVSISSSGDKSTSLFSLGYNNQEGVLKYDRHQRYIARLNHEIRITPNIKVGGDITGFHSIQENSKSDADVTNALWAAPIVPIQYDNNTYYSMPSFQRAQVGNPMARLNLSTDNNINKSFRFVGNVFAEAKFLRSFTWRSTFFSDLAFNSSRGYTPLPYRFINLGEGSAPTDTTFNTAARTAVNQGQSESRRFQQDHTLTFTKTFNSKHNVTALAGFTTLFQGSSSVSGSRTDTSLNIPRDPSFWYLGIANLNNPISNAGGGGEEAFMSFLGRVNYSYSGKYLLNASIRRDGSSKFSPANRWGTFGSIGVGWVISQEDFFSDVKHIDFLKLRGAWGTVGSGLGLPPNLYLPGLNTANVAVFGDNVYGSVAPAYVPDPNLHWEVVRGIDIGLDVRALRNKLSAEITWYDRTTKDILTTITLPGTAGNYNYRTNLGTITNKGIELNIGWTNNIGKDFTYSINANMSHNTNKVVSIGDNISFQILGNGTVNRTVTGQSIGHFWGYVQTGVYQVVADFDKLPGFPNSLPGDISYKDVNGNGVIDPNDRINLGSPFPAYNFGGNVTLGYKGFDLIIDGQGVAGNKIYTQRRTATFAVLNYEANRLNAWTGPGTSNVEPILDNTRGNNFLLSTYYLEPGDYFRIRTLQLGYTFSPRMLNGTPIKNMRLYISGQNIATFTKATGYTPEVSISNPIAGGADNGTYPVPAVYSLGINVTF